MSDNHFEGRSGVGGPLLVGMNKSKDPASLQDNEHAHIENMRVKGGNQGGILVSRGGQGRVSGLDGCVEGISDIEPTSDLLGLFLFGNIGSHFVAEKAHQYRALGGLIPAGWTVGSGYGKVWAALRVGNFVYATASPEDDGGLVAPHLRQLFFAYPEQDAATITRVILSGLAAGDLDDIYGGLAHFNGSLFVAVHGGPSVPGRRVYRYDGVSLNNLDLTASSPGSGNAATWLVVRGVEMLCVLNAPAVNTGSLYRRSKAAVWTSVSAPAGYTLDGGLLTTRQFPALYDGDLFIGGVHAGGSSQATVLRYNGTTIVVSNEASAASTIEAMVVWPRSEVLYVFRRRTSDGRLFIDTFDGKAWVNEAYDFGLGQPTVVSAVSWNKRFFLLMTDKLLTSTSPLRAWEELSTDTTGYFVPLPLDGA